MLRTQTALIAAFSALSFAGSFSGTSALEFTRKAVGFGPRPPGSDAIKQLQTYIAGQLKSCKCQVSDDVFTASTPRGPIVMKNIVAKFPGKSGRSIVITGHYDTKLFPGRKFVGASDGGSSAGFLLEMARVLAGQPRTDDVYLVWFDGEEAIREEWAGEDNLYGSRHMAQAWLKDGRLRTIKALINIDMIGDKHLNIKRETNGSAVLNRLVWQTASELGYAAYFVNDTLATDDDHMPFVKLGVPAIDLIDFDYPAWHTDGDTMDKLSAASLETVGLVVEEVVKRLERQ